MTAKEYLSQAQRLDQRIDAKLEQVASLNALATKATSTMTGMPHNPSPAASRLEAVITKIVDLEDEINRDIDELVDIKRTIVRLIKRIADPELKAILELRYLSYVSWEQIAVEMGFTIHHLYKKHAAALDACESVMAEINTNSAKKAARIPKMIPNDTK